MNATFVVTFLFFIKRSFIRTFANAYGDQFNHVEVWRVSQPTDNPMFAAYILQQFTSFHPYVSIFIYFNMTRGLFVSLFDVGNFLEVTSNPFNIVVLSKMFTKVHCNLEVGLLINENVLRSAIFWLQSAFLNLRNSFYDLTVSHLLLSLIHI